MKQDLETLNHIKKIEAPALLWNKIQQKITNEEMETFSTKWVYTIAASVLLLLCLNIFAIANKSKTNNIQSWAKNMNLLNNDNFYNEQ